MIKSRKGNQRGREDTATISVILDKEDYRKLHKLSEQQETSMSGIVRNWIRSKLK